MSFLERLYLLMEGKDINKNELCKILEINSNSFVNWENRQTLPKGETLIKMAEYFNVSVDYLLGYTSKAEAKDEKQKFLDLISDVSPLEMEILYNVAKAVLQVTREDKED